MRPSDYNLGLPCSCNPFQRFFLVLSGLLVEPSIDGIDGIDGIDSIDGGTVHRFVGL